MLSLYIWIRLKNQHILNLRHMCMYFLQWWFINCTQSSKTGFYKFSKQRQSVLSSDGVANQSGHRSGLICPPEDGAVFVMSPKRKYAHYDFSSRGNREGETPLTLTTKASHCHTHLYLFSRSVCPDPSTRPNYVFGTEIFLEYQERVLDACDCTSRILQWMLSLLGY